MGLGGPGEAESGVNIFKGDHAAPRAIDEPFNGVEGSQMARIFGFEVFGLTEHLPAIGFLDLTEAGNLLREDPRLFGIV